MIKLGLEAKLALGIIVLFGLILAGYYAFGAKFLNKHGRERLIYEHFDSEPMDSHFALFSSGSCSWKIGNGVLTMHESGNPADAGGIMLADNLSMSKPFVLKTKVRFYNSIRPGWYGQSHFSIAQQKDVPGILGGYYGLIFTSETPEGNIRIVYRDAHEIEKCWNGAADKWETCTPNTVTAFAPPSVYHIMEFYSDGDKWHMVLKDAAGKVLETTSPVRWRDTLDKGGPHKFYFGEHGLAYYSTDMDVDFIYAGYEAE